MRWISGISNSIKGIYVWKNEVKLYFYLTKGNIIFEIEMIFLYFQLTFQLNILKQPIVWGRGEYKPRRG